MTDCFHSYNPMLGRLISLGDQTKNRLSKIALHALTCLNPIANGIDLFLERVSSYERPCKLDTTTVSATIIIILMIQKSYIAR